LQFGWRLQGQHSLAGLLGSGSDSGWIRLSRELVHQVIQPLLHYQAISIRCDTEAAWYRQLPRAHDSEVECFAADCIDHGRVDIGEVHD
jgi:hypothetical protein